MKMPICLALALLAAVPGRAQLFGPNATGGLLLGGLAGGIIGHNDHNQTGRGIAIGAASGLILGSIADQANDDYYQRTEVPAPNYYVYRRAPTYYYSGYADTDYDYGYTRPNYAVSGALLGGLAGGIIGYNNHYQTGRGILIGAASGLILGSIAEHAARERELAAARPVYISAPAEQAPAQAAPEPPTQVAPAAPSMPSTPMSSANGLFGRN
jgi:outer membrane lipoprotein SlyB